MQILCTVIPVGNRNIQQRHAEGGVCRIMEKPYRVPPKLPTGWSTFSAPLWQGGLTQVGKIVSGGS